MHLLLALYWLAVPLAPLNPIEQDTLPISAVSTSLGFAAGNGIVTPGPELSVSYELLLIHPVVARAGLDMRMGNASTRIWPDGEDGLPAMVHGPFQSMALGVDVFYYRGTDKLTGYLGMGALYSFQHYRPDNSSATTLLANYGIDDVTMKQRFGYRLFLGLRFRRVYSFEIGVSELRPDASFSGHQTSSQYFSGANRTRLGSVKISIGRIWTIRRK